MSAMDEVLNSTLGRNLDLKAIEFAYLERLGLALTGS